MNTFYEKNISSGVHQLSEEEARHALTVLRLKTGDTIRLVDGEGGVYQAMLTQADKKVCAFEILEQRVAPTKPFSVHLVIAPTKNIDRMEWMVEKLGEIGVDRLTLLQTERSERTRVRLDRLEKKAISAMKQSGNAQLMKISDVQTLDDCLAQLQSQQAFLAHVSQEHLYLAKACQPQMSTTLFIGPEGDFTDEEVHQAKASGVIPVSLGHSVLRTETAGLLGCYAVNLVNEW